MKNRKWLVALGIATCAGTMQAQTQYDVTPLFTPELNGTARFVGMGGAMSALGADLSVMGTNPAGIGVYRSNDVALTVSTNSVESNALGTTTKRNRLSFDQIGFVYSNKVGNNTPLRYINFGFNYHKYNNFNKKMFMSGDLSQGHSQTEVMAAQAAETIAGNSVDNAGDAYNRYGWLGVMGVRSGLVALDTNGSAYYGWNGSGRNAYQSLTTGGVSAYDFNMSMNIQDNVYLGITVGVYDVDYSRSSSYSEMGLTDGSDITSYTLNSRYKVDGTGYDVKLGVIYRPLPTLRLGLAVHTPTWYDLSEFYDTWLNPLDENKANTFNIDGQDPAESWGTVRNEFDLRSPWRLNVSAGYTVGKTLALDAEYELADYGNTEMRTGDGYEDDWSYTHNQLMKHDLKAVHTVRLGMEAKLLPELSLRLGYNFNSAAYKKGSYKELGYYDYYNNYYSTNTMRTDTQYSNEMANHTVTVGLGYKYKGFYVDMAYLYRQNKSDFYTLNYDAIGEDPQYFKPVKVKDDYNRVLLTLGYKF